MNSFKDEIHLVPYLQAIHFTLFSTVLQSFLMLTGHMVILFPYLTEGARLS